MSDVFEHGERIRLTQIFTRIAATDTTANSVVTLTLETPDGTNIPTSPATAIAAATVTSTADYTIPDTDVHGWWVYRWVVTGGLVDATEGIFYVRPRLLV